jgi:asparagine synthase (glutamine-hydrolysing)
MVGQDAVAFYLLAEQVSRHVKVVQSGQGADEVFGGYFWYPRMAAETEGSRVERFRPHYFDRDHEEYARMIDPALVEGDHTAALLGGTAGRPMGADSFIDRCWPRCHHPDRGRPGQAGGQHDHGLGPGGPGAVPGP